MTQCIDRLFGICSYGIGKVNFTTQKLTAAEIKDGIRNIRLLRKIIFWNGYIAMLWSFYEMPTAKQVTLVIIHDINAMTSYRLVALRFWNDNVLFSCFVQNSLCKNMSRPFFHHSRKHQYVVRGIRFVKRFDFNNLRFTNGECSRFIKNKRIN